MWLELTFLIGLVVAGGLFSGAELATMTVRKSRLVALVDEHRRGAVALLALRARPDHFIATVQIGITVVGAAAAAYGADVLARRLAPLLARVPLIDAWADDIAFVVVVVAVSFLTLVLGELVPKSLALRATERYALLAAVPLRWLSRLARPFVWVLTATSNLVLRPFDRHARASETLLSSEEVRRIVDEAGEGGGLDPKAGAIAGRALGLGGLIAADVMVPRADVVAVAVDASAADVRAAFVASGHSRLVVHTGAGLDDTAGYVSLRDFIVGEPELKAVLRPLVILPETMSALDVIQELQQQQAPLALVVDEHGTTAGLLTREDLAHELLGEMLSQHVPRHRAPFERQSDGSVIVDGAFAVRDLNAALGADALPEREGFTSVAGACLDRVGRVPHVGERIAFPGGATVVVVEATAARIRSVRMWSPAQR